jgi:mycofactocin system glycosyltransferase
VRREPAGRAESLTVPVVLDPDVRTYGGGRVVLGGHPARLLRLRSPVDDVLADDAARGVVRTLVDGGLAHPRPGPQSVRDLTVVVPVHDRADELDRCLTALGNDVPVLVVDDGSTDPAPVAAIAQKHGAGLLRREQNGGPAAARNDGLSATDSRFVAFLDSDCTPAPGWLEQLIGHVAEERVAAVAPRVRSAEGGALLARYARARGPLDAGPREAGVRPGGRVAYVPTAALLVRRAALGAGFDPALRYGEDVDLVWRLHDAGHRVRYDPRTVVTHTEPATWPAWLARRHRYGTSAAPLSRRHRGRLTPLVLPPWHTLAVALLAAGHPLAATAAAAVPAVRVHRQLRAAGLPTAAATGAAARATARAIRQTAAGLGGAGAVVTAPVLLALTGPRRTRRAAAVALLTPPVLDWLARRPAVDPLTWTALRLADDLAYASGVWRGCWTARTAAPLLPRRRGPR